MFYFVMLFLSCEQNRRIPWGPSSFKLDIYSHTISVHGTAYLIPVYYCFSYLGPKVSRHFHTALDLMQDLGLGNAQELQ